MGGFVSESGAEWKNIPGTSLFVGSHPTAKGYAVVDAVTKQMILLLPEELDPLADALKALPKLSPTFPELNPEAEAEAEPEQENAG